MWGVSVVCVLFPHFFQPVKGFRDAVKGEGWRQMVRVFRRLKVLSQSLREAKPLETLAFVQIAHP